VSAVSLIDPQQVIPCHYNTFPPIEADAQAFKQDVQNAGFSEVIVLDPGGTHTIK
jgi:L-ascorbate metabolism protein UlaG (beta-lactamase superfamily)